MEGGEGGGGETGSLPEPARPPRCPPSAGCELNQEKRTWTVKPQKEGKQDCKLLLSTVGVPAPRRGW